jgi:hypothetical protein
MEDEPFTLLIDEQQKAWHVGEARPGDHALLAD